MDDIKLLMAFHGSELYFIKSNSFSIQIFILEISFAKTYEWKFMQYLFIENSQMILNGCMDSFGMHGQITKGIMGD
jgi:hypothetical protein